MALDLPRQAGHRPGITSRRSIQPAHDVSFLMAVATVAVFVMAASAVGPHLVRGAGQAMGTVRDPFQRHEPLAQHRLRVATHPEGAVLQVQASGGSSRKARTPFATRVAEGEAGLTLSPPGYNTLKPTVDLGRDRSLDLCPDPRRQP